MRNDKPSRVDAEFIKELKEIKLDRIRLGLDKKIQSDRRLTKALVKTSFWIDVKRVLKQSPLEDDTYRRVKK